MSDAPIPNDKHHLNLTRDELDSLKSQYQLNADDHDWKVNFKETDEGNEKWTLDVIYQRPAGTGPLAAPTGSPGGAQAPSGQFDVAAAFETLMADREGRRKDVYLDSLGKPTVGIGHLVRATDGLKVGDVITDERISLLFKQDGSAALNAARGQVAEAKISDARFLPYLASVNFQLGTGWTGTFPDTWKMIVNGKYEAAAKALDGTKWAEQTPVRVRDFQGALRRLAPKS